MTSLMRSENFSLFSENFENFCKEVIIEKVSENGIEVYEDYVVKEDKIEFFLNGKKFLSVMSLAQYQDAHIIGFLLSEAVINSYDDVESVNISEDGLKVYVKAQVSEAGYGNLFKEKTLTSGCCVGVTGNADELFESAFIDTPYQITSKNILTYMYKFHQPSKLFDMTGCVHKAELVLEDGSEYMAEDIGRHNAIDKVIGLAKMHYKDVSKATLYVSGRLSKEMVVKAVMHKIPIVVSKAAVTFQGVQAANAHGVTLIGFARNSKMNIYTHSGRVVG